MGIAHLFLQKEQGNDCAQLLLYLYYLKDFHFLRGPQSSHFSPTSVVGPPWPLPDTHAVPLPVFSLQSVLVEVCCKVSCWEPVVTVVGSSSLSVAKAPNHVKDGLGKALFKHFLH